MILSLKRKLYFLFTGSIMLVFTIVFFLLASENVKTMQNAELSFVNRQATNLILLLESSANYLEILKICEEKYGYSFRLFTEQDVLLYESNPVKDVTEITDAFLKLLSRSEASAGPEPDYSTQSGTYTFCPPNGRTYYGILCSIYTDAGIRNLAIVKEKSGIKAFSSTVRFYFLIWIMVLAAVVLVSVLVIRQAIKPTEKAMQSQKDFIASASHELKAPLAVLLSAADVIEASPGCSADIRSHAALMEDEISRMAGLVQDLLLLSSIDAGSWTLHPSQINVDTLLITLYEKFEMICKKKSVILQLRMPEDSLPPLVSDENRLNQVLSIFLDNAISYSPEHSSVILSASVKKGHLAIHIIDHGIGISEEDRPFIFDRFYRCDKSRTKKGHYGLGLSVAKELVSLLNGKISVSDTPGGGCTFTITLPYGRT